MNPFKTFINKVGERVREVTPQSNSNIIEGILPQENLVEGFVCPTCFKKFDYPELLEKHYDDDHMNPSANYLCPVCQARLNSQKDLESHYSSNHKERDLSNHSLELLKDELVEVTSSLREERWQSEELKKEVERLHEAFQKKDSEKSDIYIHKFQLDAAEEAKLSLSSEVINLRKQLSEALQHTGKLLNDNQSLEAKLSENFTEKNELSCRIDDLNAEIKSYKNFMEEAHMEVVKLKEDKKLKEKLENNIDDLNIKQKATENELQLSNKENKNLRREMDDKHEQLKISLNNIENVKNECDLIKDNLNTKIEEVNGLTAKLVAKQKILEEFQTIIKPTSDDALKPENAELLKEYTTEISRLDKQNKAIALELEDSIKHKLDASSLLKVKSNQCDKLENTFNQLKTTFNETKKQLTHSQEECLKSKTALSADNEKFEAETKKLQFSLSQMEELKDQRNNEIMELKKKMTHISKSEQEKTSNLEEVKCEQEKLKVAHNNLLLQFDEIVDKLASKENDLLLLSNEKLNLFEESDCMTRQIESLQNEETQLRKTALQTKADLADRQEKIDSLNNFIVTFKQETEQKRDTSESLMRQLEAKIETSMDSVKELKDEIQTMTETMKYNLNEKEKLSDQLKNVESEVKNVKDSYDLVVETNTAYHDRIKESKVKLEEMTTINSELQNEVSASRRQLVNIEEEKQTESSRATWLEEKVGQLEAELAGLAGDKLELEVRVEAASEERQSILNRCLNSEKEVERVQQEINLLRRKLEDSTAALHDLGRANQSLQIETNKLAGRKWVEDSDVPNCTKCAKNFTVTNRRHHCRNCGQIFCNDCSSKQAPIEFNKKSVRVCDSCHVELSAKM